MDANKSILDSALKALKAKHGNNWREIEKETANRVRQLEEKVSLSNKRLLYEMDRAEEGKKDAAFHQFSQERLMLKKGLELAKSLLRIVHRQTLKTL